MQTRKAYGWLRLLGCVSFLNVNIQYGTATHPNGLD